jgi:uncharacterized repeat protein (TIGR03833 family)
MSKRRPGRGGSGQEQPKAEPAAPFNNPFGALQGIRNDLAPAPPAAAPAPAPTASAPPEPEAGGVNEATWGKIVVGAEKKGRAGKTITRVHGLSPGEVPALTRQIKTALGCGATFEGDDLLLLGSLVQRCVDWLEARGAKRVVVSGGDRRAGHQRAGHQRAGHQRAGHQRPVAGPELVPARAELRAGQVVEIVLKKDQASGALTRGVLREILTRSATHPHGIKVRLEDGAVGRVKRCVTVR